MKKSSRSYLLGLTALLFLALTYAGRTLHLVFEADDFRFLWWAVENRSSPWEAFTDPPLFGDYYRPIVSLVWWGHSVLLGLNDYGHHFALMLWWLLVLFLFSLLLKRVYGTLVAFLAPLFLLGSYAAVHPLVWKSWLTITVSVSFELLALLFLVQALQTKRWSWLCGWFVLAHVAFLTKESSLVVLPVVSILTLFIYRKDWSAARWLASGLMLTTSGLMLHESTGLGHLRTFVFNSSGAFQNWLPGAAHFADAVFSTWFYQGLFCGMLLWDTCRTRGLFFWMRCGWFLILLPFCFYAIQTSITTHQATALTVVMASFAVVATPLWRLFVVPAVWLAVSFFPLPFVSLRLESYAFHSALAVAWITGLLASRSLMWLFRRTAAWQPTWKRGAWVIAAGVLACLSCVALYQNQTRFAGWIRYATVVYHTPETMTRETVLYDLAARAYMGTIHIDTGYQLSTETWITLAMQERFGVHVSTTPQPSGVLLEALSETVYPLYPREKALPIRIDTPLLPADRVLDDPYFNPDRFESVLISNCDQPMRGMSATGTIHPAGFPIGVSGQHLQVSFPDDDARCWFPLPDELELRQEPGRRITAWLHTRRWDGVERLEVRMHGRENTYTWDRVEIRRWKPNQDWVKVELRLDNTMASAVESNPVQSLEFIIHRNETFMGAPLVVGFEELKMYWHKKRD